MEGPDTDAAEAPLAAIDHSFQLFPPSEDEESTARYITQRLKVPAQMTIVPTHHINDMGEFTGFHLAANKSCFVGDAPFNQQMFFGLSACACQTTDAEMAKILADRDGYQRRLDRLIESINGDLLNGAKPASFECIPFDTHGTCTDNIESTRIKSTWRKGVDNAAWALEPPKMLGVFHGYIRLPSGERSSRLFVVCDSGCQNACVEYYNMMLDLGADATLEEAVHCEETWWLQKACSRARNRLIFLTCEALGLAPQQSMTDIHSHDGCKVAVPVCETLRHDFYMNRAQQVVFLNSCVDTTRVQNGILCKMHETEGVWVFRGAPRANSNSMFGGMFGARNRVSVFPMETYETNSRAVPSISCATGRGRKQYLHFNNDFIQNLTMSGWERDYGITELVPIAVVHG